MIQQNKDQDMTNFENLLENFQNNNTVSTTDLQPFSRPGVQINQELLSNLLLLPKQERTLAISKLSSYLAYTDTNETYRNIIDLYNASLSDPNTKAAEKTVLTEKKEKVEYELTKAKDYYQELSELKQMLASINGDADTARANMFTNVDGTQYLGSQQDEQSKHNHLIVNFN